MALEIIIMPFLIILLLVSAAISQLAAASGSSSSWCYAALPHPGLMLQEDTNLSITQLAIAAPWHHCDVIRRQNIPAISSIHAVWANQSWVMLPTWLAAVLIHVVFMPNTLHLTWNSYTVMPFSQNITAILCTMKVYILCVCILFLIHSW